MTPSLGVINFVSKRLLERFVTPMHVVCIVAYSSGVALISHCDSSCMEHQMLCRETTFNQLADSFSICM